MSDNQIYGTIGAAAGSNSKVANIPVQQLAVAQPKHFHHLNASQVDSNPLQNEQLHPSDSKRDSEHSMSSQQQSSSDRLSDEVDFYKQQNQSNFHNKRQTKAVDINNNSMQLKEQAYVDNKTKTLKLPPTVSYSSDCYSYPHSSNYQRVNSTKNNQLQVPGPIPEDLESEQGDSPPQISLKYMNKDAPKIQIKPESNQREEELKTTIIKVQNNDKMVSQQVTDFEGEEVSPIEDFNQHSEFQRGLTDFESSYHEKSIVGAAPLLLNYPAQLHKAGTILGHPQQNKQLSYLSSQTDHPDRYANQQTQRLDNSRFLMPPPAGQNDFMTAVLNSQVSLMSGLRQFMSENDSNQNETMVIKVTGSGDGNGDNDVHLQESFNLKIKKQVTYGAQSPKNKTVDVIVSQQLQQSQSLRPEKDSPEIRPKSQNAKVSKRRQTLTSNNLDNILIPNRSSSSQNKNIPQNEEYKEQQFSKIAQAKKQLQATELLFKSASNQTPQGRGKSPTPSQSSANVYGKQIDFKSMRGIYAKPTTSDKMMNKSNTINSKKITNNVPSYSEMSDIGMDLTKEESRKLQFQMIQSEKDQMPLSQEEQIKKNIENMDIQDVNRNTRFFKDYLKDQIKQQIKKTQLIAETKKEGPLTRMFTRKFSNDMSSSYNKGEKSKESEYDPLSANLQKSLANTIKFTEQTDPDHERMLRNQKLLKLYNSKNNSHTFTQPKKTLMNLTAVVGQLDKGKPNKLLTVPQARMSINSNRKHQPDLSKEEDQEEEEEDLESHHFSSGSAANPGQTAGGNSEKLNNDKNNENEGEFDEELEDEQPQNGGESDANSQSSESEEERRSAKDQQIGEGNLKKIQKLKTNLDTATFINDQLHEKDDEDLYEEQIIRLKNSEYNKWIIHPESDTRTFIDGLSFLLLMIIALYVPFIISFDIEAGEAFQIFEVLIDIWFITEIVLNFFTGYYNKGLLIMNLNQIAWSYVKGYLWIDILSSIPISFISLQSSLNGSGNAAALQSAKFLRMIRLTRYLRLMRLLRFVQLNRLLSSFEVFLVSEMAHLSMKFLKICTVIIFVAHWIACALYTVTLYDNPNEPNNWLTNQDIQDASVSEIYVNALYWVITTTCTVGYGDFHPVTTSERIVVIIAMILQSGMFAYIIGDISRTVSSFNRLASHFRERMNYVEQFLREKDIPISLRQQVKRYLEYNWELKKLYKIEETELLTLLNDNLRGKIIVYFNGRILQSIDVLGRFPIEFLSNLSFILQKRVYAIDDNCVMEGEIGQDIFFIISGKVAVLDKRTKTHISDLVQDQYFGEISFFSEIERQATVKARDFSEMLVLRRDDFLQMAGKVSPQALSLFHQIKSQISSGEKNFKILLIKCYICSKKGHIAKDCSQFPKIRGNLKKYLKLIYNQSAESDSTVNDLKKQSPIMVSFASLEDQRRPQIIEELYNQQNNVRFNRPSKLDLKKRTHHHHHLNPSQIQKQSVDSHVTFKQPKYYDTNLSNFVVLPKELQHEINKSEDEKNLDFKNIFNARPQNVFLGESFDQQQDKVGGFIGGRISQQKAVSQSVHESKTKQHQVASPQSQLQQNSMAPFSTMNSKMLESKPTPEKINTLVFKTQMTPSENGLENPSELALSHFRHKPLITGEDLVILEDENENQEDEQHHHQQQQVQQMISEEDSLLSNYEEDSETTQNMKKALQTASKKLSNKIEEIKVEDISSPEQQASKHLPTKFSGLKLVQKKTKMPAGPPKHQNELTTIIGRLKRFGSKNFREQQKMQQSNEFIKPMRRKIQINMKQQSKIKTVVRKTFTTLVETEHHFEQYEGDKFGATKQKQDLSSSSHSGRNKPYSQKNAKPQNFKKMSNPVNGFYQQFVEQANQGSGQEHKLQLSSSSTQSAQKRKATANKQPLSKKEQADYGSLESDNDVDELKHQNNDRSSSPPDHPNEEQKQPPLRGISKKSIEERKTDNKTTHIIAENVHIYQKSSVVTETKIIEEQSL